MYKRKIEENLDCGIYIASKVFGGKWKCCILDAINRGISRPMDIYTYISEPSKRTVEMQLAELLVLGVVERCVTEGAYPKKSEYRLSTMGKSILPILDKMDEWGLAHSGTVKERIKVAQEA